MNEIELKYKQALLQLGNCFDAIFALSAKVEMLTAELEALKAKQAENKQGEMD